MIQKLKTHLKDWLSRTLWAYDADAFIRQLRGIGVQPGTTLMVHSSWQLHSGFKGKPATLVDALKRAVGEEGLLVMTSMPYHNMSSADWLAKGKPMNVRRSPSMMGLVSEVFRRSAGVHRSLSATHPLLAWGKDAEAFLAGHENTDKPFGSASPFARLVERNALLLGHDAPFSTFTFTHYVEGQLADTLAVPLYETEPRRGIVIDHEGVEHEQSVYVLSAEANRLRREARLVARLQEEGTLHQGRIGNTRLVWILAGDLLAGARRLAKDGPHFFDSPTPHN
jgi:aminoglycoside 3-N-acetyltransferase